MLSVATQFFSEFAGALNQKDATRASNYYFTHSKFISREYKQVCSGCKQLIKANQQFIDQFFLKGLSEKSPKTLRTLKLSNRMFFCMVEWQSEDENEKVVNNSRMSYTLKNEGDNPFKIMVNVMNETVDDVNALLALQG
jgi:hypothetical protein